MRRPSSVVFGSYVVPPKLVDALEDREIDSVGAAVEVLRRFDLPRTPHVGEVRGGGRWLQSNLFLGPQLAPDGRRERVFLIVVDGPAHGVPVIYPGGLELLVAEEQLLVRSHSDSRAVKCRWGWRRWDFRRGFNGSIEVPDRTVAFGYEPEGFLYAATGKSDIRNFPGDIVHVSPPRDGRSEWRRMVEDHPSPRRHREPSHETWGGYGGGNIY